MKPAFILALLLLLGSGATSARSSLPVNALQRGNGPEPSTLDAHRCPEVACGNILRDLYEGLVAEDARGQVIPGMAERWVVSADGRRWTFHLRAGLRWSNGQPLTAGQVVASFRRAFEPATAAPFAVHFDAIENATRVLRGKAAPETIGIVAPDDRTVVFRLDRSAALPQLLLLPIAYPVYLPALREFGAQHTRPGLLPVVAWLSPALINVVSGSAVVEQVFGIPGVGRYFVQGALNRDYTLVLGMVLVIGAAIVLINAIVDVMRSRLDPRLRDTH